MNKIASDAAVPSTGCGGESYGNIQAFLRLRDLHHKHWLQGIGNLGICIQSGCLHDNGLQGDWLQGHHSGTEMPGSGLQDFSLQGFNLQDLGLRDRTLLLHAHLQMGELQSMAAAGSVGTQTFTVAQSSATGTSFVFDGAAIFVRAIQGIRVFFGGGDRHQRSGIRSRIPNQGWPIPIAT